VAVDPPVEFRAEVAGHIAAPEFPDVQDDVRNLPTDKEEPDGSGDAGS